MNAAAANEIKPIVPSETGELTLGQQAEAKRWLASEGQRAAEQCEMPDLSSWQWQRDALESSHMVQSIGDRVAQTDRELQQLLSSMGLSL